MYVCVYAHMCVYVYIYVMCHWKGKGTKFVYDDIFMFVSLDTMHLSIYIICVKLCCICIYVACIHI